MGRRLAETFADRLRGNHSTEPEAKAMRNHQIWVKPYFWEAKARPGLRRFRLRRQEKVNGVAVLIAAGNQRQHLLSWRVWGLRPFPSRAAGVGLPLLRPTLTVTS